MEHRLLKKVVVGATVGIFLWISAGIAAEFPYPKVEFSADMTMKLSQPGSEQAYVIEGKVFSAKGKERREISRGGRAVAVIKERGKGDTVTLMPDQKMYMKNQGQKMHKDPEAMIRDGELKMTQQGSEKINGQSTTKYKIESTQKSSDTFSGYAWFTKQNIPIRFKGTATDGGMRQEVEINYTNIDIRKQNPKLFAVPSDYRQLPTGMGGMGGMGGDGQGLTPEQMNQLKEMMKNRNQ